MKKKVIYLASPYGFSKQCNEKLIPEFIIIFERLGFEVWEPFDRNQPIDTSVLGWAYETASSDLKDLKEADAIFAIVNGNPPDEGVMIELGFAIAMEKPIFLFRDDFRRCTDSEEYPLNLMIFAGLPREHWMDFFYTSLDDLENPNKALMKFKDDK